MKTIHPYQYHSKKCFIWNKYRNRIYVDFDYYIEYEAEIYQIYWYISIFIIITIILMNLNWNNVKVHWLNDLSVLKFIYFILAKIAVIIILIFNFFKYKFFYKSYSIIKNYKLIHATSIPTTHFKIYLVNVAKYSEIHFSVWSVFQI